MINPTNKVVRYLLVSVTVVVLAVIAVGAGWWFFIREDAQLVTSAPEIPAGLLQATPLPADRGTPAAGTAAPATDSLAYIIIPEQSEAAYFADEKLARLPLPSTAKGTTNQIHGALILTGDGTALATEAVSEFTVDLRDLESDESRRDRAVQDALDTDLFPLATFTISEVTGYDPSIPDGEEQSLQMVGTLDLHGVQREVVWEVKARREGNVITALATVNFRYDEFDITAPEKAGIVSVEDDVTLQVQIVAVL